VTHAIVLIHADRSAIKTLGGALAEAIGKSSGGKLKATAAETSASLQNIQQLVAGTHQVAFSLADTAADAALFGHVDNFTVTDGAIPEPATAGALTLVAVGVLGRRRKA